MLHLGMLLLLHDTIIISTELRNQLLTTYILSKAYSNIFVTLYIIDLQYYNYIHTILSSTLS